MGVHLPIWLQEWDAMYLNKINYNILIKIMLNFFIMYLNIEFDLTNLVFANNHNLVYLILVPKL